MAEALTNTEKYVLAQLLVCGDVHETTLYRSSEMMTTTQQKALSSLDRKGYLDYTLYTGEH